MSVFCVSGEIHRIPYFYVKYGIPLKIMKIVKIHGIYIFCGNHTSKLSIFLRKYKCFCDLPISAKIMVFEKKVEISKNIIFLYFCNFYGKSVIIQKTGPRVPKTPKNHVKGIGFTRVGASGPRGCGKLEKLRKLQKHFCVSDGK